jgi:hypothetical protein
MGQRCSLLRPTKSVRTTRPTSETQPNPIFVTYRSIPGRTPHDQQINFTQLGRGRYQIRFERLVIDREGPRNPSLRLYASCRVSDREVGRSATRRVFDGPASSAHNNGHELRWATTVSLEPDQEVTCGFSGQWSGSLYGGGCGVRRILLGPV